MELLSFETATVEALASGWVGFSSPIVSADRDVKHGGQRSALIHRTSDSPGEFSAISKRMHVEFSGRSLELRGFLRTEQVQGFAGLWVRFERNDQMLALENMQARNLHGTTDWAEYVVRLPVPADADSFTFGVLLEGIGKVWADDLQVRVDDLPVPEPRAVSPPRAQPNDREFDSGSKIKIARLTGMQIENLVLVGRVWGFLKYHHPGVTSGERHWDYELFRILPVILGSPSRAEAQSALVAWIDRLGFVKDCSTCANASTASRQLAAQLGWLEDKKLLGRELTERLRKIHGGRAREEQFYVSLRPGVGNPVFENELNYPEVSFPDAGYQLLALFRFWNIVAYWFPYRSLIDGDWNDVLREFVPRMALAANKLQYQLQLLVLTARVQDSHANAWGSLHVRPPSGPCQLPVKIRFIENKPIVSGFPGAAEDALRLGDIIREIEGKSVSGLIGAWSPYYGASNERTKLRDIARFMGRGKCEEARIKIQRGRTTRQVKTLRVPAETLRNEVIFSNERSGEPFQIVAPDVLYVKLSSTKVAELLQRLQEPSARRGVIIDLRGYPADFFVFALGSVLVDKETPFVRFTTADLSEPGTFRWGEAISLQPTTPHYSGRVALLVDEATQSQAEYTSMALRAAPRTIVVGTPTAGADGNISMIPLPGKTTSSISGIGVFYPDKRPTQRVGIQPDIEIRPTIAGIRAGRDEVLEAAIREILRPEQWGDDGISTVKRARSFTVSTFPRGDLRH